VAAGLGNAGEGDGLDTKPLAGGLHFLTDLGLQLGIDQTVDGGGGQSFLQIGQKVGDGGKHRKEIGFALVFGHGASKGGIRPTVVGAAEDENGVDLVFLEEALLLQLTKTEDEGGGVGAIGIAVAGVADGGAGPAVVLYQMEPGLGRDLMPPGFFHLGYVGFGSSGGSVVDGIAFGNVILESGVAVAENDGVVRHGRMLLSHGKTCCFGGIKLSCIYCTIGGRKSKCEGGTLVAKRRWV